MRKQYFLTVDTETTQTNQVADFAAVISDRKGRIVNQCAVLVGGVFTDKENHPLFFDPTSQEGIWSKASRERRYTAYENMLSSGARMIASVQAINNWLGKAAAQYQPILTAYNLAFDLNKCVNTGIDLTFFNQRFCLWQAAYTAWARSKAYRQFVLDNVAFNNPTIHGNMSYKTNAETVARFIEGNPDLPDEPHTALEDIVYYELPILNRLLRQKSTRWLLTKPEAYNWRELQVSDWFKPA